MAQHHFDNLFMQYALSLAKKGWGKTGVNPLVGAVIALHNCIIGTGYHRKLGEMHGEIVALLEAGSRARGATLYVNLEPCCCAGRTPPCVNSIVKAGIKKVMTGTKDPNPLVNGNGMRSLLENGIEVDIGLLQEQSEELNRWYFHSIVHKQPYIILKMAFSSDWCISGFENRYITSGPSLRYVHSLRSQISAIMVGINTVINDNPRLTDRHIGRNNPARVVIDPGLRIPLDSYFLQNNARRIIITSTGCDAGKADSLLKAGVQLIQMDGEYFPPEKVLELLYQQNLGSVLIEGGSVLASQFIAKSLFNELLIIKTEKPSRQGISMKEEINQVLGRYKPDVKDCGEDKLYHVYRDN